MKDFFEMLSAWIVMGILGMGALIVIYALFSIPDRVQCYAQYKNYNPQYGLIQGCMIDYKGEHIPSDKMRVM
jgi:hypothetical protein